MDMKKIETGLTGLAGLIIAVGLILCIRIILGSDSSVSSALYLVYGCMILAGGVAVIFGLVQLFSNIKNNLSLLIGIVAFVVLAFICYSIAGNELLPTYGENVTATTSQLSGAGIMLMYTLVAVAVAAAIIGEVVRLFK